MNVSSRSLVSVRLRKSPLIAPNNGAAGGADFLQFASVLIAPISRHGRGDEPNAYQTTLSVTSISVRWYLLLLYTKKVVCQYFFANFLKKVLNNAKTSETLGIQFPDNNGGFRA